jgi:hypothetical protein
VKAVWEHGAWNNVDFSRESKPKGPMERASARENGNDSLGEDVSDDDDGPFINTRPLRSFHPQASSSSFEPVSFIASRSLAAARARSFS